MASSIVLGTVDEDALTSMTMEWLDTMGLSECDACVDGNPAARGDDAAGCAARNADATGCAAHDADTTRSAAHGHAAQNGETACTGAGGRPARNCDATLCGGAEGRCHRGRHLSAETLARLRRSMLRWAVQVLSGPGGLASYLRTGLLEAPLAGPSVVLDAGPDDRSVPASLERLVRRRDRHCRFPGCDHPAHLSQVHHIIPRSRGGPTRLGNLLTLCSMHHLIAVHSWGWEVRLNPDGTTTAIGPDGRVLEEREPPLDPPLQAA
ncbi:HNH endonuclease [Actinomadura alba]|uniref:HNH endonuclease n=1 Tax=Actinomadura alba TaxID=406431 RepID=A0ABR7M3H4_9ACTN|nr:HNH endonuclease [Actinomadura alba]